MKNRGYAVILHKTGTGYCAEAPDLPGCIATGRTLSHTKRLMAEAITFHLEGMQLKGDRVPEPVTQVAWLEPKAYRPKNGTVG